MRNILISFLFSLIAFLAILPPTGNAAPPKKDIGPIIGILLAGESTITMQKKIPSLALMVAQGTEKIEMAWIPGSDGATPVNEIQYKIHLATTENFTPDPSNLQKTVTGTSQAEVTGLQTDTLYYGKIIAVYSKSTSDPSNSLQTKTYKYDVQQDSLVTIVKAVDLGLGTHTTVDGSTFIYTGGTPPTPGSYLFSEDNNGKMTLRRVDSVSVSGTVVTVYTSSSSLSDVLDRASIYSSFQLFDVASQADSMPTSSNKIATARNFAQADGSQQSQMIWKNRLLKAEQVNRAYDKIGLKVTPQGQSSTIKLFEPKEYDSDVTESFTATVTAKFEPELITTAEWGGFIVKSLDSAKVAAKGTLSLTALAQYDFSASGTVSKNFQLFKRTWISVYTAGPVPVYQEITLSMNIVASASANAKIKAKAEAVLAEVVEIGATYDGSNWTPYITHNEADSLTASLNIVGGANAEIRIIPKIEVEFYAVVNSSLTVEPFAKSSLSFEETTNNVDFLSAHPERLVQLTSFKAFLGMEANVAVNLSTLGYSWDAVPSTCVLGTGSCLVNFDEKELFSIPKISLSKVTSSNTEAKLELKASDGTFNPFIQGSVNWEAFPSDAKISVDSCTKTDQESTCSATVKPGEHDIYEIFASGYGVLNSAGRQYKSVIVDFLCGNGNIDSGEECDDGNTYNGDGCTAECKIEPICGDGNIDPGEECDDGNNTDGDGCSATCTIEASCGNGIIDSGETCDGSALNNQTCQTQGFDKGTLACSSDCSGYETNGCSNDPVCGNGIKEAGEKCDGSVPEGMLCSDIPYNYQGIGTVSSCNDDCTFNTDDCCSNAQVKLQYYTPDCDTGLGYNTVKWGSWYAFQNCNLSGTNRSPHYCWVVMNSDSWDAAGVEAGAWRDAANNP